MYSCWPTWIEENYCVRGDTHQIDNWIFGFDKFKWHQAIKRPTICIRLHHEIHPDHLFIMGDFLETILKRNVK